VVEYYIAYTPLYLILSFSECSTKTRSGSKVGDVRPVPPRAFAYSEKECFCPINIYKEA
jgi:hypothetical protein